jgi:hypothetical protein
MIVPRLALAEAEQIVPLGLGVLLQSVLFKARK